MAKIGPLDAVVIATALAYLTVGAVAYSTTSLQRKKPNAVRLSYPQWSRISRELCKGIEFEPVFRTMRDVSYPFHLLASRGLPPATEEDLHNLIQSSEYMHRNY